jgi:hypothetical protein
MALAYNLRIEWMALIVFSGKFPPAVCIVIQYEPAWLTGRYMRDERDWTGKGGSQDER